MRQGTMFIVLRLPSPWPGSAAIQILEQEQAGTLVRVVGHPDGHLSLAVEGPLADPSVHYDTQPLVVNGPGMMLLTISWSNNFFQVRINGTPIKSLQEDSNVFSASTKIGDIPKTLSLEHADAATRCQNWMTWRKTYLSVPRRPVASRRLKTDDEQVHELEDEIRALRELADQVRAGNGHMLRKVAGSLRSLLYWEMRKNNTLVPSYNPLLLRIAARANVSLAVYAMPNDENSRPAIVNESQFHLINNKPTLKKVYPGQMLADIQEWLNTPVGTERFTTVLPNVETTMTVKDIIEAAANTLGGAHFDEDVPNSLDTLRKVKLQAIDFLSQLLLATADIVVELGTFVVRKWHERKP